jgi:RNA recognition motif-containing protein
MQKRSSYDQNGAAAQSNNIMDAEQEPRVKRQRVEPEPQSDFLVKVERTAAAVAAVEAAGSDATYEVFVSDLPWGTTKEADVTSYFGIAGAVVSVQMPTMADGSTVGVAIVRFAAMEGMTLALRMDGYPFNGKNIRVAVHKSS